MEITNFNLLIITLILFCIIQVQVYNIKITIENFTNIKV
jgi:hypothetical protein